MVNWIILWVGLVGIQPPSAAEELLEALRRKRPPNEVIQPASAVERAVKPAQPLLLPEGSAVVDRAGQLSKDGIWWTFVFATRTRAGHDASWLLPPVKLLPNASLEVMVRTARGADAPVTFAVSGDMTVFQDENYLLVRLARRAAARAAPAKGKPAGPSQVPADVQTTIPPPDGSQGEDGSGKQAVRGARGTDGTPAAGDAERLHDVPVDEVLRAMRQQEPKQPILATPPLGTGTKQDSRAGATEILRPDGATIVRRPGRLLWEKDWWVFAFESDHPDEPELPIRLLPNKSVELMVRAAEEESNGLVFLVTGDVTLFEGQNYLLPRVAIRRIDLGNLTK